MHKQILYARERVLGPHHDATLGSMRNIAQAARHLGIFRMAEHYGVMELQTRLDVMGRHHPETIAALHNLSQTLFRSGQVDAARELQEIALRARKEAGNPGSDESDLLLRRSHVVSPAV